MNTQARLSNRESQIAERIAWGSAVKEVANDLAISIKTVDNTIQKIYKKIECGKLNELSAWWFCTHFNISMDLSPLKRSIVASALLILFISGEVSNNADFCRYKSRTGRSVRTEYVRTRRK